MGKHRTTDEIAFFKRGGVIVALGLAFLTSLLVLQMSVLSSITPQSTTKPTVTVTVPSEWTPPPLPHTYNARPSMVLFPANPKYPYTTCTGS